MSKLPLVSVIVTTKNNHATLDACLQSIKDQTYAAIELVVVDNSSTDDTVDIAKKYTSHVYTKGPERCAQRNYAVEKSSGEYVVIIDSDMELSNSVIAECVEKAQSDTEIGGVVIPEESFGEGFWAKCKTLERSFYVGVNWIEAARFFTRKAFLEVGGYDEALVSGEDWDLSQRVGENHRVGRIGSYIYHNEGHINLFKTLRKKSYYAKKFTSYTAKQATIGTTEAVNTIAAAADDPQSVIPASKPPSHNPYAIVFRRFGLFLSQPLKLFRNPFLGLGVLFMKICEFGFGAFGYMTAKDKQL